jgi:hypothetical protein
MNGDTAFLLEFVLVFVGAPEFWDGYALPLLQWVIMNCVDRCNVVSWVRHVFIDTELVGSD